MTPPLTYRPQTNSGKVTVTVNHVLKQSIQEYIDQWGWNNCDLREAQIKRTEKYCKTVSA